MTTTDSSAVPAPKQAKHEVLRIRQDTRRRMLTVTKAERLTQSMARITFGGPDLVGFGSPGHDDHVKLFFPATTPGTELHKRDYTPRQFDAARQELVIDFVLHEGGPATSWARTAAAGDMLEIGGPRGSTIVTDDFDWYLLVGDETALPAIGRRVEELRLGVPVTTVVLIADGSEKQDFATRAKLRPIWVERRVEGQDDGAALLRTVQGLVTPPGDGFVWIAAEAEVARALRRHVLEVRRHAPAWVKASGYWVKGQEGAHASFKEGDRLGVPTGA